MTGFGSPCGACKFLRRKCVRGCVFAPYFCHEQGAAHFAAIHKVFGASNFSKILMHLPVADRSEAAVTVSYEAQARLQDPVYGCVAHIFALQQQVSNPVDPMRWIRRRQLWTHRLLLPSIRRSSICKRNWPLLELRQPKGSEAAPQPIELLEKTSHPLTSKITKASFGLQMEEHRLLSLRLPQWI